MRRNFEKKTSLAQSILRKELKAYQRYQKQRILNQQFILKQKQKIIKQQSQLLKQNKENINQMPIQQQQSLKINRNSCRDSVKISSIVFGKKKSQQSILSIPSSKNFINRSQPAFPDLTNIKRVTQDISKCKKNILITSQLTKCLYEMQNPNHQINQSKKSQINCKKDCQPFFKNSQSFKVPKVNFKGNILRSFNLKNQDSLLDISLPIVQRRSVNLVQSLSYTQRQAILERDKILKNQDNIYCVRLPQSKPPSNRYKRGNNHINLSYDRTKDIDMTMVRQQWKKANTDFAQPKNKNIALGYDGKIIDLKKTLQKSNIQQIQYIKTISRLKTKQDLKKFNNNHHYHHNNSIIQDKIQLQNIQQANRNINQMMKAITINQIKQRQEIDQKHLTKITKKMLEQNLNQIILKVQN